MVEIKKPGKKPRHNKSSHLPSFFYFYYGKANALSPNVNYSAQS